MSESRPPADRARRDLYRLMNEDLPFEEKASRALELGKEVLGVENGHLTAIDPASDYWEAIASTDGTEGPYPEGLVLDLSSTYCRRTVDRTESIALHDAARQGWAEDSAFKAHGLAAYHGSPLIFDDDTIFGTVCFVADQPRADSFSEGETLFAELVTRMIEFELRRARHRQELERRANLILVLNRVLRHNLRNDLNVIMGRVEQLAEPTSEGEEPLDIVRSRVDGLLALSDKARALDLEDVSAFAWQTSDITAMIEEIVDEVRTSHPEATISVDTPDALLIEVMSGFDTAILELVENAAKHGGPSPRVSITARPVGRSVEIGVHDDGPGLPPSERAVLDGREETPLVHGSGLGLWLVHWLVTGYDGTVDTTVTPDGTTVTLTVPRTTVPIT